MTCIDTMYDCNICVYIPGCSVYYIVMCMDMYICIYMEDVMKCTYFAFSFDLRGNV